nr:chemotaxis protein CheB [Bosea sp. AAP35]
MPGNSSQASGGAASPVHRGPHARRAAVSSTDLTVVAVGASAGGLEASRNLLNALPPGHGMAFILVQHLDPTHKSMMVDLLAGHTSMSVLQAVDGMQLQGDHLYAIPPGSYLSVANGHIRLSAPDARHGARLPFDFLLHSLAQDCGPRAMAVVLSGTGADGSLGILSVKERGGFVIAQDPAEAGFDGMPRSAIATGAVAQVLPVASIPAALATAAGRSASRADPPGHDGEEVWLADIITLLRERTSHDFTLYKPGTLQRRIERRRGMAATATGDMAAYLAVLRNDEAELQQLATDLLINVTSFFRDPKTFALLAETIIPDMVARHPPGRSLRIWVAGCSTGEETYSLAMLFREQITAVNSTISLQLFASDVDAEAVASARDGVYPDTIEAEVSPARLARFFSREGQNYRVLPELRGLVVFTIQDVLADPPFSRLDMVSCRNLLIYLQPEAQARILSLFHFALREGGILLLGSSETVSHSEGRFEVVAKAERIYRHIGRSRPGEIGFSGAPGDAVRVPPRPGQGQAASRQSALGELCKRVVIEAYAPAAVMINAAHECLYSLGPTSRYLQIAPGYSTHDILAMAPEGLRTRLRAAILQAKEGQTSVRIEAGRSRHSGQERPFSVAVQPVMQDGERLFVVAFIDEPIPGKSLPDKRSAGGSSSADTARIGELEKELDATRAELRDAVRNLEMSGEEQRAINEEALSVNEEFQSTNEELLTSKEELQSLNEELTALNGQLQETLERQRTTSDDLQNVLYSTDVATIFLDRDLKIRFFTPATKALFNVIPGDVGRPLADLASLAADGSLPFEARTVLQTLTPLERRIEAENGVWFLRRIMPYRAHDNRVEGVVITFSDITEQRRTARTLSDATSQSEQANIAKSRFLAAASHDLRQPLQGLALIQGLLGKVVEGEKAQTLVARLGHTIDAMSGMLNTLLDINQIEAGTVQPDVVVFPIGDLLASMRDSFAFQAQAQGLALVIVGCSAIVRSDPQLLQQMLRNLIANALKYTKTGRVLIGCRRRAGKLTVEVWDTGVGIPGHELQAIFDEYHQIDNAARQRSLGLGLGLSIVQRLGHLLGHGVQVRSTPGKGSVFTIELGALETEAGGAQPSGLEATSEKRQKVGGHRIGTILIIEDDPELRELLDILLKGEGHRTIAAADGPGALALIAGDGPRPDVILSDYNLPSGMDGLQAAAAIRAQGHRETPVIILTGDISTETLRVIKARNCLHLSKPVKVAEVTRAIQRLLAIPAPAQINPAPAVIAAGPGLDHSSLFIIDDDEHVRGELHQVLENGGYRVASYGSCESFLSAYHAGDGTCLLVDAYLPGMSGMELLRYMREADPHLPAIMITGHSDVPMAVEAMKAGAFDFIEKPVGVDELLASVGRAVDLSRDASARLAWKADAARSVAGLTSRQHQIMDMVLAGHPSKNIAADLGISQRTVENHRAAIMRRTGTKSLPALARLALAATRADPELPAGEQ